MIIHMEVSWVKKPKADGPSVKLDFDLVKRCVSLGKDLSCGNANLPVSFRTCVPYPGSISSHSDLLSPVCGHWPVSAA